MSWLSDHLEYNKGNESPDYFHLWSGLFAISAQLGRRVWLAQGYRVVFPNMYICLVAPSATVRKGPPKDAVVEMILDAQTDAILVPQRISSTSMLIFKMMQGIVTVKDANDNFATSTKPTLAVPDEIGGLINKMTLGDGIEDCLNTCYTCPRFYDYSTFSRGDEIIPEPCLSVLASTTPGWMKKNIGQSTLEGGLYGRFVWMYQGERKHRVARPVIPPDIAAIRPTLVKRLITYQQLSGEMFLDDAAGAYFDAWYETLESHTDPLIDAFTGRIHEHALKVAMCLCVGEEQFPIIRETHMAQAIKLLEVVVEFMPDVLDSSKAGEVGVRELIVKTIMRKGKRVVEGWELDHSPLVKALYHKEDATVDSIAKSLDFLERAKMLMLKKGGTRSKKTWVLLNRETTDSTAE